MIIPTLQEIHERSLQADHWSVRDGWKHMNALSHAWLRVRCFVFRRKYDPRMECAQSSLKELREVALQTPSLLAARLREIQGSGFIKGIANRILFEDAIEGPMSGRLWHLLERRKEAGESSEGEVAIAAIVDGARSGHPSNIHLTAQGFRLAAADLEILVPASALSWEELGEAAGEEERFGYAMRESETLDAPIHELVLRALRDSVGGEWERKRISTRVTFNPQTQTLRHSVDEDLQVHFREGEKPETFCHLHFTWQVSAQGRPTDGLYLSFTPRYNIILAANLDTIGF